MKKMDCRAKLVEIGTRLFAERGLYGVSIRELSQAAAVSISMVSYYFGGKEGLYAVVLQEQFACFDQIEKLQQDETEPMELLERYLRWTIQRHRNNPYLLRFYTSELTNPTVFFPTIVAPAINRIIRVLSEAIQLGIQQKIFRNEIHAVNASLALAGMVNYFFLSLLATEDLISHSPEQDEQLVQQYLIIFTRGILLSG